MSDSDAEFEKFLQEVRLFVSRIVNSVTCCCFVYLVQSLSSSAVSQPSQFSRRSDTSGFLTIRFTNLRSLMKCTLMYIATG